MEMNQMSQAERILHKAVHPPLSKRVQGLGGMVVLVLVMGWIAVDLELTPETFFRGLSRLGGFFSSMWPPSDGGDLQRILYALAQTFAMAFAGTAVAAIISVPLGLLGAKTIVPFAPIHFAIRRVFDFFRGIPVLVWALILVSAFGLGPFAGVVALAVADIPVLSKLYAEAFENIDPKQAEGLKASGAGPMASLRYATLPQVLPVMASQGLFYLESNFRNAAVLGI
ncbi:MAG: phosphate/phosphonate ABC transporter permease, partial [Pseudomonadota bacterium]